MGDGRTTNPAGARCSKSTSIAYASWASRSRTFAASATRSARRAAPLAARSAHGDATEGHTAGAPDAAPMGPAECRRTAAHGRPHGKPDRRRARRAEGATRMLVGHRTADEATTRTDSTVARGAYRHDGEGGAGLRRLGERAEYGHYLNTLGRAVHDDYHLRVFLAFGAGGGR